MKIKQIQTLNCYKSKDIPIRRPQNITFQALQLKKADFATKSTTSYFMKIGALATAGAVSIKELFLIMFLVLVLPIK